MKTEMKKSNKKAQITIWIIIAIIIVATIVLIFLLRGKQVIDIFRPGMPYPQQYIEKCAKDATLQAIEIMLPQAGYIQPTNYILYENHKVGYLCYNKNFYYSCINQEPLYIEKLEEEIKTYIEPRVEDCFYVLEQEYRDKRYEVNSGPLYLNIELNPKQVEVDIEKKFEISKEETKTHDKFKVKFNSPLYELASLAREIVNQEAEFCNFEYLGYMLLYPGFSIDKKSVGSGQTASKIYVIKDRYTNKALYIAIRSCAIPPGF